MCLSGACGVSARQRPGSARQRSSSPVSSLRALARQHSAAWERPSAHTSARQPVSGLEALGQGVRLARSQAKKSGQPGVRPAREVIYAMLTFALGAHPKLVLLGSSRPNEDMM